jgi:iron complex transport system ATP-binding protein
MLRGVSVRVGKKNILKNITMEVKSGVNLILGPNGSGKTTLLRTIIGMHKPVEGEIISRERKSYVPSEFFSAQIMVKDVLVSGSKMPLKNYLYWLDLLEISWLIKEEFSKLSTGQKRLCLIAKALTEGDLIIMDEPTSNLDISNQLRVMSIISNLKKEKEFLIATNDVSLIDIADHINVIKEGELIFQGSKFDINEEVLSLAYNVKVRKYEFDGRSFYRFEI